MAKRIQAVTKYRPRIKQGKAADERRYLELVTQRTTLSTGVVRNVQESEVETIIGLLLEGRPVHTGVAIYRLSIGLDGEYKVHVRLNKRIAQAANAVGAFRGEIANAENIGRTSDDMVAQWNVEHPDDPVED